MEYYILLFFLLLLIIIFVCRYLHVYFIPKSIKKTNIPPGPYPYPIIGNILHLITQNPHRSLFEMSKTYGPLMSIKLGTINTIVISSPEIAKEALTKNDMSFSNREVPDIMRSLGHHDVSLVWLPGSSSQWRTLRKICASNIFAPQKLDVTKALRQIKVQEMLNYVVLRSHEGEVVDIGRAVFTTVINSLSSTFFSKDFAHYHDDTSNGGGLGFREIIEDIMVESGKPNVSDFFPILRFLDPQGVRKKGENYTSRLMKVFDNIIEERMKLRASCSSSHACNGDLLDCFLDIMEGKDSAKDILSRHDFLHLLVDLFVAGTDSTTSTIEWAMAELLNNPKTMAKAKGELNNSQFLKSQSSSSSSKSSESDFIITTNFPYLHAIVKETFRLHPPVPMLHHKSNSESQLCDFVVPKDTQVLINLWAIGRSKSTWGHDDDVELFKPERFMNNNKMDVKGHDFELMPFGAGRRICPGLPLAHRSVHFILASLIHGFDWKIIGDYGNKEPREMDMSEKNGLALRRSQPLRAIPVRVNY